MWSSSRRERRVEHPGESFQPQHSFQAGELSYQFSTAWALEHNTITSQLIFPHHLTHLRQCLNTVIHDWTSFLNYTSTKLICMYVCVPKNYKQKWLLCVMCSELRIHTKLHAFISTCALTSCYLLVPLSSFGNIYSSIETWSWSTPTN